MRELTFYLTVAALLPFLATAAPRDGDVFRRATCNRDACLRAVVASSVKPGPSSAKADCQSFIITTVTPCPSTVFTSTTTTTVTAPSGNPVKRDTKMINGQDIVARQATTCTAMTARPTGPPPPYASACSGSSRYSSACSCNGVTPAVTTLPASTVSTVSTATTTTTTDPAVASGPAFYVLTSDGLPMTQNDEGDVEIYPYFFSEVTKWNIDPSTGYFFQQSWETETVAYGSVSRLGPEAQDYEGHLKLMNRLSASSIRCSLSNGGSRQGGILTCLLPGTSTVGVWCKTASDSLPSLLASASEDCIPITFRSSLDGS